MVRTLEEKEAERDLADELFQAVKHCASNETWLHEQRFIRDTQDRMETVMRLRREGAILGAAQKNELLKMIKYLRRQTKQALKDKLYVRWAQH